VAGCTSNAVVSVVVNALPNLTVTASPTAICPGGVSNIISTGATNYTVMPGSLVGSNVTVSPVSTQIYTVTGVNASGCINTRTVQLVVNPTTSITATATSPSVCSGNSVTLSANGATTYTWNPGNLNGSSVSVSPGVATNYSVTGTNSLGCVTSQATVQVNVITTPTVSASANPTSICLGGISTLTATGAQFYTWLPGGASNSLVTVGPLVSTVYTVTGFATGGVCFDTETVSLVVNALPNLTVTASPTAICPGGLSTINSSGALSYTVNPIGLTGANVTVSPLSTTIYTVTGLSAIGCTNTRTVQLVVNPTTSITATAASPSICSGSSVTLSANGATTYTWNPGNLNGSSVSVSPGVATNYSVTGTNSLGCVTSQATVQVNVITTPTVTASANPTSICLGGVATLTATGAQVGLYTWLPGGATGGSVFIVSPLVSTIYTVIGFDAGGVCSDTETLSLVVNSLPSLSVTASPTAICPGGLSTINSTGALSYTVNPIGLTGANVTVSPVSTTIYTVTGLGAFGCTNTGTVQLLVNSVPLVGATTPSSSICLGASAVLTGTGATSYTWVPIGTVANTVAVSPTVTTTYTVIGANASGCINQNIITITVNPIPSLSVTSVPVSLCPGSSATLTASGATSYSWNTGATGAVTTVTNAGAYIVTGTLGSCSASSTITILPLPGATLVATASPTAICPLGVAICSVTGAATYTWSTGSNANNISVSPTVTTTYSVIGTNGFGCTNTTAVTVIANPSPTLIPSPSSASLCASSSATINVAGPATSYTCLPAPAFSSGNNFTLSPSITTIYTISGTSPLGCVGQTFVTITVAPVPTIVPAASTPSICDGSSLTLSATGANSYTWLPVNLTGSLVTVSPTITTNYTVIGASTVGCTSNSFVTVTVVNVPTLTANASPASICPGASSTMSVTGASSYTWMPGLLTGSSVLVSPLSTTVYSITGANSSGCSSIRTLTLTVNPVPSVSVSPINSTICAGSNILLTGSGASVYSWTPGSLVSPTISANPTVTTTYTVTGANAFGCLGQATAIVSVQPLPVVSITPSATLICPGGSATLTASGGNFYSWNTGSTNTTIIVSPSVTTNYSVLGFVNACSSTVAVVTVSLNSAPSLSITGLIGGSATVCAGNSASLTASGAANYTWNPGGLTTNAVVLTPTLNTFYTLTGASAFGCTSTAIFTIIVSPLPSLTASATSPTVCAGSTTSLIAGGASSYTWNPGNIVGNVVTVTPTVNTIYTLSANSAFGCNSQTTVPVNVQALPVITATASPAAICIGGSATLTAVGASSFIWSNSVALATIIVNPTTTTVYSVAGGSGVCLSNTVVLTITVNPLPTLSVAATSTALCPGGTATLTASGAVAYTWNPGALNTNSIVVTPLASTIYTLNGTSADGCSNSITSNIVVNPNPTVVITSTGIPICAGACATLAATGANSYTWMPGSLTGSSAVVCPTVTTDYTVTGNSLGCIGLNSQNVTVNSLPVITTTATPASICNGFSSTLTASGANTYSWTTIPASGSLVIVSPTINTTYLVSGTNAAGCVSSQSVGVTVNSVPSITITSTSNTICLGATATLTGAGTLSYTWNPSGANTSTLVVNPTATTVYTLIGSNGFGCTTIQFFTLNVVPIPTVNASASSLTVCEGFTTNLIATGANSYTWQPGALNGSLVVVSPTITTNYTVSGDISGCSSTSTVSIFVNPLPTITANASPSIICNGATSTLTAFGALSYTWIPGLVTGSNISVNPTSTSIYTVVGLSALNCPNFAAITLTVLPTPTVFASSSSTAICIGNSATLSANGATTYTWNPGSLTNTIIVVNPTSTTVYSLTGSNGGCSTSNTISITVNNLPIVSANSSTNITCFGSLVTFTATGANAYSWLPIATVGATTSANPTITTIYTVTGTDLNGCNNSTTLNVSVNPLPSLSITAVPLSTICFGGSATINVSGANTYTWNVINLNTNSVVVSPTVNSTYTVNGTDINGCIGNQTISLNVVPIPTINVSPSNPSICAGFNTTLTANGAANYTWLPSNTNGSFAVFNPTTTTTYTVIGDNGGNCPATVTVSLFVNPLPANVTALCSGTITCSNQTVSIIGASSNTNVSYNWVGPGTFTSSLASTSVNVWGNYTLSVTDNITSCTTTLVLNVPTDNSIPSVTASASGSITCAIPTVTLIAANTTSNAGYLWTGPSTFSSILQSFTTNAPGVYTVVVTDLTSGCNSTKTVAVISRTYVPITATISPATCSLGISNNDGKITLSNFTILDKFDFVQGATYTGTATYSNAVLIPSTGIITSNLSNPANTVSYTIRYFDAFGCTKDTTLRLIPVDCVPKVLGLAKAVTSSSLNADGTYNVNYKLTIKNTDSAPLKDILITENLVNTFPAPTTFTVVNAPVITSAGSSLSLNGSFDGINQTNITSTLSVLGVGKTDTIVFTVKVRANGKFGPFNNRIVGTALTNLSVAIRDTSTNGLNPDPDGDLNPTNNSLVTPVSFSPNVGFGLSKVGSFNKLDNNTYDVYYSITVHNLGNDTLRNIVVKDSLFGAVIKAPAKYTIRNGPATTNNLTPNTLFDGRFNINLLVSSASKLAPASEGIINFTINVRADSLNGSTLRNIAFGNALAVINNSNTIVSDTSNSGTNPDVNQNSICNEFLDNAPTIFILPATASPTLFVPQGFSPNGDGINDLFVINGLSNTSENSITVFNRWGNRVYYHGNYNNTWDGYPNIAGTLGKDKLPQGTYYYIIEFKGSGQKPITGFIVLEY
jgi:gliding motility-associated-like protein